MDMEGRGIMANMIFQHTWQSVIDGTKTQTRRIVKPGGWLTDSGFAVMRNDKPLYEIGRAYAVMPARGVKGIRKVADIKITGIRREDVRQISEADAIAEGFKKYRRPAVDNFLMTWTEMHDPKFRAHYDGIQSKHEIAAYLGGEDLAYIYQHAAREWHRCALERPDALYQAWALTFRVVNVYADAVAIARELLAGQTA